MSANKSMTAERLVSVTPKRRANPAKQAGGVSYGLGVVFVSLKPNYPKFGIADGKFRLPTIEEDRMLDREIESSMLGALV